MTRIERKLGFIQSPQMRTRKAVYRGGNPYHEPVKHLFDSQPQMDYFIAMARKAGWQISYATNQLSIIVS